MALTPREIGLAYDQLADVWNGDAFDRENGIAQHQRALSFCRQKGFALDVGCGSSGRIIELLLRAGFAADAIEGLDVSARMLELARVRHPQVTFHQADICVWQARRRYDFISAWDSIWHVPLDTHGEVLEKLFTQLTPGGVCIFTLGGLDEAGEKTDASMGPRMYYSTPGIPLALEVVRSCGALCRHLEFDQYPEPHAYMIVERQPRR